MKQNEKVYVLKAYDYDGCFYGYCAPHPDEEDLPFYDDDINNAIKYETIADAEFDIERFEEGSELQIVVEAVNKKD